VQYFLIKFDLQFGKKSTYYKGFKKEVWKLQMKYCDESHWTYMTMRIKNCLKLVLSVYSAYASFA